MFTLIFKEMTELEPTNPNYLSYESWSKEIKFKTEDGSDKITYKYLDFNNDEEYVNDDKCQNPDRMSRFPEVNRLTKSKLKLDTGVNQKLIQVCGRVSKEDFQSFLDKCPHFKFKVVTETQKVNQRITLSKTVMMDTSKGFNEYRFKRYCPVFLMDKINSFKKGCSNKDMHDKIMGLYFSLFGIFPQINEQYVKDLCELWVYPYLLQGGYSDEKIHGKKGQKDLKDAFNYIRSKKDE